MISAKLSEKNEVEVSHMLFFYGVINMQYVLLLDTFLWNLHNQVFAREQENVSLTFSWFFLGYFCYVCHNASLDSWFQS